MTPVLIMGLLFLVLGYLNLLAAIKDIRKKQYDWVFINSTCALVGLPFGFLMVAPLVFN